MAKKPKREDVLRRLGELAFSRGNDAVKLAFLPNGEVEVVDSLDLSLLSEVKRGNNGTVEVKLVSRLEALRLLAELLSGEGHPAAGAEDFFRAMDEAARRVEETP